MLLLCVVGSVLNPLTCTDSTMASERRGLVLIIRSVYRTEPIARYTTHRREVYDLRLMVGTAVRVSSCFAMSLQYSAPTTLHEPCA